MKDTLLDGEAPIKARQGRSRTSETNNPTHSVHKATVHEEQQEADRAEQPRTLDHSKEPVSEDKNQHSCRNEGHEGHPNTLRTK